MIREIVDKFVHNTRSKKTFSIFNVNLKYVGVKRERGTKI